MALLWADDFSTYGIGGEDFMLDGSYSQINQTTIVADPDPSGTGAPVVRISSGSSGQNGVFRQTFPSSGYTFGIGMRVYLPGLPISNLRLPIPVSLRNVSNSNILSFRIETDGYITAYKGDAEQGQGGTILGTTSGPAITANAWTHIEFKGFCDATTGTVEIRVNGNVVLNLSSQDTLGATGPVTQWCAQSTDNGSGSSYTYYIDDLIEWDTSGSYNNDFMGTCVVGRFTVDGDSAFNWTASTGSTGYNLIDESGPSDADYISADATPPAASTFTIENLPTDVTSVRGIMLYGRMNKSDGGDCQIQMSVNDGTNDTSGADRAITTAYTYWHDILETNVTTGVPFTPTEFDSLLFKVNRTL